jgi:hypothetical protein
MAGFSGTVIAVSVAPTEKRSLYATFAAQARLDENQTLNNRIQTLISDKLSSDCPDGLITVHCSNTFTSPAL